MTSLAHVDVTVTRQDGATAFSIAAMNYDRKLCMDMLHCSGAASDSPKVWVILQWFGRSSSVIQLL